VVSALFRKYGFEATRDMEQSLSHAPSGRATYTDRSRGLPLPLPDPLFLGPALLFFFTPQATAFNRSI